MEMTPSTARTFWKALMDNASSLVTDAQTLLEIGSYGRSRSLTVLAQEELGKALWLYETFEGSWSTGDDDPLRVPRLTSDGRRHAVKYMESFVFGKELAAFWGYYESYDYPSDGAQESWDAYFAQQKSDAEAAGERANQEKMSGFYVDLDENGAAVHSPADVTAGSIADDLQTAAQVVEMLLIKDHSRMKLVASTPYDSTYEQQHRLLPIAHPEDWAAAPESFKNGDYLKSTEA